MRWTSVMLCALCSTVGFAQSPSAVRIAGATNYALHSLVKLKAEGADAQAGGRSAQPGCPASSDRC